MKYNKHTSDRQQTVEGILSWCRLLQGTADKVAIYKAFQKCLPGGNLRLDLLAIGCVDDPYNVGERS